MSFQEQSSSLRSRLHIGSIDPMVIKGAVALAAVVLVGAVAGYIMMHPAESFSVEHVVEESTVPSDEQESEAFPSQICVYVSGCVVNPGVCYLDEGARVADAIEQTGGMTEEAAESGINLARLLNDGEQIIVPSKSSLVDDAPSAVTPAEQASVSEEVSLVGSSASGLININTADLATLQTLNGIGASKAQKIIDHRSTHGLFKSIDELTNVSGIGEKTLDAIRAMICV